MGDFKSERWATSFRNRGRHRSEFARVLFTDVEMPGTMDGLKLARAVRDRWPPVTIMVTSGRVTVTKDDMPENGLFFAKPYPPDGIIKALSEISARIQG